MKRILPTLGFTVAGVATILNFNTRSASSISLSGSATVVSSVSGQAADGSSGSGAIAPTTTTTAPATSPATAEREQIMSQLPDWVIERIDEQFPEGISLDLLEQVAFQLGVPFDSATGGSSDRSPNGSNSGSSDAPPTTTTTLSDTAQVIDGPAANTPFGPYQVEVTIDGGKIVNVVFIRTPRDGQSMAIQRYAIPRLLQQTLENQSGEIDFVSGATYTSYAYQQSLQAALDAAGF